MVYVYRCSECNKVFDVELDPNKDLPKAIKCKAENCKGDMFRVWSLNSIIPEHMKASSGNEIRYDKSSRVHKKSFGPAGAF